MGKFDLVQNDGYGFSKVVIMRLRRACLFSVVEKGGVTSCISKPRGFSSSSEQPQQCLDLDVDKVAKFLVPLLPNEPCMLFGDDLVVVSASGRSLVIISRTDLLG